MKEKGDLPLISSGEEAPPASATPAVRHPAGPPPSPISIALAALEVGETIDIHRPPSTLRRLTRWPSWLARHHRERRFSIASSRLGPTWSTARRLPNAKAADFNEALDAAIREASAVSPATLPPAQGRWLVTIDLRSPAGVALRSRGLPADPVLIFFPPPGRAACATFRDVLASYGIPSRRFALKVR